MAAPACTGCRERDHVIADLRHRVSQLETQVERRTRQLRQAQRAGKRLTPRTLLTGAVLG
jgi:hypothetical protein